MITLSDQIQMRRPKMRTIITTKKSAKDSTDEDAPMVKGADMITDVHIVSN